MLIYNINFCECWCGLEAKGKNKFAKGHIIQTKEKGMKISAAKMGHPVSEETRKQISKSKQGQEPWNKDKTGVYSEDMLKRMSDSHLGQEAWNLGIPMSEEAKRKDSESQKKLNRIGINNPNYGRKQSEESKEKNRQAHLGKIPANKGLPGKPMSEENKEKLRIANTGNQYAKGVKHTKEWKQEASERMKGRYVGELSPNFGKHLTDEHKLKMSIALAGHEVTEETRQLISIGNIGKPKSEEHKLHISEATLGKYTGENSNNWKGGITPEMQRQRDSIEYKEWMRAVYKRDQYKCHRCNINTHDLVAHHIINFAKLYRENQYLWDVNNGITFCRDCHNQFHKKYNKVNNNQQQIFEFIYENH